VTNSDGGIAATAMSNSSVGKARVMSARRMILRVGPKQVVAAGALQVDAEIACQGVV
jgi:hypothetical protein